MSPHQQYFMSRGDSPLSGALGVFFLSNARYIHTRMNHQIKRIKIIMFKLTLHYGFEFHDINENLDLVNLTSRVVY